MAMASPARISVRTTAQKAGLIASAAAVIGVLGPWVDGLISVSGLAWDDGKLALCAAIVGAAGFAWAERRVRASVISLACGLGIAGVGIYHWQEIERIGGDGEENAFAGLAEVLVQPGWGLWFTSFGGFAIVACAVVRLRGGPHQQMV